MEIQEGLYLLKRNCLVSFLAPNWKLHKLSLCTEHIVQNPRVYTDCRSRIEIATEGEVTNVWKAGNMLHRINKLMQ